MLITKNLLNFYTILFQVPHLPYIKGKKICVHINETLLQSISGIKLNVCATTKIKNELFINNKLD